MKFKSQAESGIEKFSDELKNIKSDKGIGKPYISLIMSESPLFISENGPENAIEKLIMSIKVQKEIHGSKNINNYAIV